MLIAVRVFLVALSFLPFVAPAQSTSATFKKFEKQLLRAIKALDERKLKQLFSNGVMSGGCDAESERIKPAAAANDLVAEFKSFLPKDLRQMRSVVEFRDRRYVILIRPHRKAQTLYRIEAIEEDGRWLARSILSCDYDKAMDSPLFKSLLTRLEGIGKPGRRSLPD